MHRVQPVADGVTAFVPPPEYLMAIAIDLGRPKDMIRLQCFYEEGVYDSAKLKSLLARHDLEGKWDRCVAYFGGLNS